MVLSPHDMETLIDLVENKLSDMLIWDGDDRKTAASLERCLSALYTMKGADRAPIPIPGVGVMTTGQAA